MTEEEFSKLLALIGAGNVGAMNVVIKISKSMPAKDFGYLVGALEDHKIFGPKLWIAYKDYAKENIDLMATGVLFKSPKLLLAIREEYPDWNWAGE